VKTGVRGHMHEFPFPPGQPKRSTANTLIDDAKSVFETQSTVRGVKGPTSAQ
jgi:hypothetical protein